MDDVSACKMLSPPECLGLSKIDHTDSTNHNNYGGGSISGINPSHFNNVPHNAGHSFNHPSNAHHHLNMRQRQLIGSSLLNIEQQDDSHRDNRQSSRVGGLSSRRDSQNGRRTNTNHSISIEGRSQSVGLNRSKKSITSRMKMSVSTGHFPKPAKSSINPSMSSPMRPGTGNCTQLMMNNQQYTVRSNGSFDPMKKSIIANHMSHKGRVTNL